MDDNDQTKRCNVYEVWMLNLKHEKDQSSFLPVHLNNC